MPSRHTGPTGQRLRHVVVLTSDGIDPAHTTRFLADLGVTAAATDVSDEDTKLDADELAGVADSTGADAVLAIGTRSSTAVAVAVNHDLPLVVTGAIDGARLRAIDDAIAYGSAVHRTVVDLRVDDRRRLTVGEVAIFSAHRAEVSVTRRGEHYRIDGGPRLRIASEQPASGRLAVGIAEHPVHVVDSVEIRAADGAQVTIDGHIQEFTTLSARTAPLPLRELVLGMQGGRRARPVIDSVPL